MDEIERKITEQLAKEEKMKVDERNDKCRKI